MKARSVQVRVLLVRPRGKLISIGVEEMKAVTNGNKGKKEDFLI